MALGKPLEEYSSAELDKLLKVHMLARWVLGGHVEAPCFLHLDLLSQIAQIQPYFFMGFALVPMLVCTFVQTCALRQFRRKICNTTHSHAHKATSGIITINLSTLLSHSCASPLVHTGNHGEDHGALKWSTLQDLGVRQHIFFRGRLDGYRLVRLTNSQLKGFPFTPVERWKLQMIRRAYTVFKVFTRGLTSGGSCPVNVITKMLRQVFRYDSAIINEVKQGILSHTANIHTPSGDRVITFGQWAQLFHWIGSRLDIHDANKLQQRMGDYISSIDLEECRAPLQAMHQSGHETPSMPLHHPMSAGPSFNLVPDLFRIITQCPRTSDSETCSAQEDSLNSQGGSHDTIPDTRLLRRRNAIAPAIPDNTPAPFSSRASPSIRLSLEASPAQLPFPVRTADLARTQIPSLTTRDPPFSTFAHRTARATQQAELLDTHGQEQGPRLSRGTERRDESALQIDRNRSRTPPHSERLFTSSRRREYRQATLPVLLSLVQSRDLFVPEATAVDITDN